jgi:D-alanine transaminase
MARFAYVNGRYVPHDKATVHVEDRGYQFADGVYEVVTVVDRLMIDEDPHLDRLERSLDELMIAMPVSRQVLKMIMRELVRRNRLIDGLVYMQITRGVAPRDHKFPVVEPPPALVMMTKAIDHAAQPKFRDGVKVITIPDIRWTRCDIKTVSLLPNCLGAQQAAEAGAYEAWQVDRDGYVTEGTSSNAWIVTDAGKLLTRELSTDILSGVTRRTIFAIAETEGLEFEERPFTVEEAIGAREAFASSATSFVTPVVQVDDTIIGDGKPGPLARKLLDWYMEYCAGDRRDEHTGPWTAGEIERMREIA